MNNKHVNSYLKAFILLLGNVVIEFLGIPRGKTFLYSHNRSWLLCVDLLYKRPSAISFGIYFTKLSFSSVAFFLRNTFPSFRYSDIVLWT